MKSILASLAAASLLATGAVSCGLEPAHAAPALPAYRCHAPALAPVTRLGTGFGINGKPHVFHGFTMYPAGATWGTPGFTPYTRKILLLGKSAGLDLARPTDQWSKSATGQTWNDPKIWHSLDTIVCQAAWHKMYVIMDLSAYKWLLESQGQDPMDASLWLPYLAAVGQHYKGVTNIAAYSIVGEPDFPRTQAEVNALTAYYRTLTDALHAADPAHLIEAGGFNNMNNGVTDWWKPIYALPHNDVAGYKVYSSADLANQPGYIKTIHSLGKIALNEEFGEPQYVGDTTYSGQPYNGLAMSRAEFYREVYQGAAGASGTIFWNLAVLLGPSHYDVSPETPGVWAVVKRFA